MEGRRAATRLYPSPTPAADWTVTIGGEARVEVIFQGAKRDVPRPYPILAVRRFGTPEPFRGAREGAGIGLTIGFGATRSFDIKTPW